MFLLKGFLSMVKQFRDWTSVGNQSHLTLDCGAFALSHAIFFQFVMRGQGAVVLG